MKIKHLVFLWGFLFSSDLFAIAYQCTSNFRLYNQDITFQVQPTPQPFFSKDSACSDAGSIISISPSGQAADCRIIDGTLNYVCGTYQGRIGYTTNTPFPDAVPSVTCKKFSGDVYGTFKTSSAFCADFGKNTGGANPQPLYCMTDPVATDANGDTLHYLTAAECGQPNQPEDPDPNPDPDPDPNPDPNPNPGNGSPGGTTNPTSGTSGSATGTIGSQAVTLNQDFKPITERLDIARADAVLQTKYLAEKIDKTTQAVTLGTGELLKLNAKAETSNTKLETLNTTVKNGTTDISGKLDTVNSNLGDVKSSLDGVASSIDALNSSLNPQQDGGAIGEQVSLPDYDTAVTNGVSQIQSTVDQYVNQSGLNQFSEPSNLQSIFTAADSLDDVFKIASSNCSALEFGSNASLDLCPYAPTISSMLEVIIWALTALFIFVYLSTLLARERL
jgi:hypothetical protein